MAHKRARISLGFVKLINKWTAPTTLQSHFTHSFSASAHKQPVFRSESFFFSLLSLMMMRAHARPIMSDQITQIHFNQLFFSRSYTSSQMSTVCFVLIWNLSLSLSPCCFHCIFSINRFDVVVRMCFLFSLFIQLPKICVACGGFVLIRSSFAAVAFEVGESD